MSNSSPCTVNRRGNGLEFFIDCSSLEDSSCHTLHLALNCRAAADYSPRLTYQTEDVWVCGKQVAESTPRRCAQHWFSQFVCYTADKQTPVAIAQTAAQLASVLDVASILFYDARTRQPLEQLFGSCPASASAGGAAADMEGIEMAGNSNAAACRTAVEATDQQLVLEVPRPLGSWHVVACAALFVQLDVADASSYRRNSRHAVIHAYRCGHEAGKQTFCGQHRKAAHICLVAQNGDVLDTCNTLGELAPLLAVHKVLLTDDIGDLEAKLLEPFTLGTPGLSAGGAGATAAAGAGISAAAAGASDMATNGAASGLADASGKAGIAPDPAGAAAAAGGGSGSMLAHVATTVGQKRPGAAVNLSVPNNSKVQNSGPNASPPPAAAASTPAKPAILRLRLTPEQAEIAMQQLQQQVHSRPLHFQQDRVKMSQMRSGYYDVKLDVGATCCTRYPCMGINLRLGVQDVQQLAIYSGPVPVEGGRRCANEGGIRRCCKQHRMSLIVMTDQQSGPLPGAAHLDGLPSMLKVDKAELLDMVTLQPLDDYKQLPSVPTWQVTPDRGLLKIWLPKQQSAQLPNSSKACLGVDVVVGLQQGEAHVMGSALPVLSISRCANACSSRSSTCRKHHGGVLHLMPQGSNMPFHVCKDLGELAIWLGVGKVEVLDSETHTPVDFYSKLVDSPMQLPMPSSLGTSGPHLAPPTVCLNLAAAGAAAAAAQPDAGGSLQQSQPTWVAAGTSAAVVQLLAGGNCWYEVAEGGQKLTVKIDQNPVGAWQRNPCRALELLIGLPPGQTAVASGARYPLRAIQRCGNEAGGRTRCRTHLTAALNLLASSSLQAAPPAAAAGVGDAAAAVVVPQLQSLQAQQLLATLARVDSTAKLARLLGLQEVTLLDSETGDDLGDAAVWSPSTAEGRAAKVQQQPQQQPQQQQQQQQGGSAEAAAAAAAMLAAVNTLPQQLAKVLVGNAAKEGDQVTDMQGQQQQQLDQRAEVDAAVAAAAAAAAAVPGGVTLLPADTSRLGMYTLGEALLGSGTGSSSGAAAAAAAAGGAPGASLHFPAVSMPAVGGGASSTGMALQSSGIAAAIASGGDAAAAAADGTGATANTAAEAAAATGFTTSAPAHLARLAAVFKAVPQ